MLRLSFFLVLTLACPDVLAFSYPTLWVIQNTSPSSVYIECKCPPPDGLQNSISMATAIILPSQEARHEWLNYYNDGLGMNPAHWTCAASTLPNPLGQKVQTTSFYSGWGEDLALRVIAMGKGFLVARENW